jgi:protein SCO1
MFPASLSSVGLRPTQAGLRPAIASFPRLCRPGGLHYLLVLAFAAGLFAQPGQLLGPAKQSALQVKGGPSTALPSALTGIGIDQKLDQQIPLDLTFKDEFGRTVQLREFFRAGKPVILVPVYYRCPVLCTQILNGVAGTLKAVTLNAGQDFEVVAVSFDPKDTPETASSKKQLYLRRYNRPNTANGWHLLTGDEANIKPLMDAIGYRYKYDPATDQYAHASGIMVATPDGRLSRYFYGIEYAPVDVRLGLVEASQNKIGNPVDQILLFCFHYDPATGKYGAIAMNMVRAAGAAFVLICGGFLAIVLRRDAHHDGRTTRRVG